MPEAVQDEEGRSGSRSVLVVDDDRELTAALKDGLAECGAYRVTCVHDGRDVLAAAHAVLPHVIVLDLVLGAVDGTELLESFREDGILRHVPVIVCSALLTDSYEPPPRPGQRVRYLAKPVSLDELVGVIDELT